MQPEVIDVQQQEAQAAREGYVHRVLVAFDQFVNVIFRGRPDETISARAYPCCIGRKTLHMVSLAGPVVAGIKHVMGGMKWVKLLTPKK